MVYRGDPSVIGGKETVTKQLNLVKSLFFASPSVNDGLYLAKVWAYISDS